MFIRWAGSHLTIYSRWRVTGERSKFEEKVVEKFSVLLVHEYFETAFDKEGTNSAISRQ